MRIEEIGAATLINADCRVAMQAMDENSVDSIVCDPPYGLSFMGKGWDHGVPGVEFWAAALRVAKPGAYLLAFGGTRTFHRLACAIEDAGWEIRDCVMWMYGSGFPKSLNVQLAMNKAAAGHPQGGADPTSPNHGKFKGGCSPDNPVGQGFGAGAAAFMEEQGEARGGDGGPWQGWGTALKPAWEPIILARKPLIGTVAANVQQYGTGGLNIDGCRVPVDVVADSSQIRTMNRNEREGSDGWGMSTVTGDTPQVVHAEGRWPANLIHDGSEEVLECFPDSKGQLAMTGKRSQGGVYGTVTQDGEGVEPRNDTGSAARFFYAAKASKSDRDEGLADMPDRVLAMSNQAKAEQARGNLNAATSGMNSGKIRKNNHPTVKPTELMRYLCRLVTPPGGTVLDPFMGSGSTGKATLKEGFKFVGIELDEEHGYFDIACARIRSAVK